MKGNISKSKWTKGEKGDPGYTPQIGKDYFTDSDKADIREYINSRIPMPDYEQNDPKRSDYIKNRPFYQYVEEITNETVTISGKCYDVEGQIWGTDKYSPAFVGIKTDKVYQLNLKCYNNDNQLIHEYNTVSTNNAVFTEVDVDGVKLDWYEDGMNIIVNDKSSTEYQEEYPDIANITFYGNWLDISADFADKNVTRIELSITGDFSRVNIKHLDKNFIAKNSISYQHIGDNLQGIFYALGSSTDNDDKCYLEDLRFSNDYGKTEHFVGLNEEGVLYSKTKDSDSGEKKLYATQEYVDGHSGKVELEAKIDTNNVLVVSETSGNKVKALIEDGKLVVSKA